MPAAKLLILTAIEPETSAIQRGLNLTKGSAPVPFFQRDRLLLAQVGVRATKLGDVAQLLAGQSLGGIILAGLAGGLSPELRVGDVVMDPLVETGVAGGRGRGGKIQMAREIVSSAAEKRALFESSGCVAVDMESLMVQRFAHDVGAAFLHVRAISDASHEALDPALASLLDDAGNPRVTRAIGMICRHPRILFGMLRVQRASARGLVNLVAVLENVLATGWPEKGERRGRK